MQLRSRPRCAGGGRAAARRDHTLIVRSHPRQQPQQQQPQQLQQAQQQPQQQQAQQQCQQQQAQAQQHQQPDRQQLRRRDAMLLAAGAAALPLAAVHAQPAAASKLGPAVDAAWQAMGGGPPDLTFPDSWSGVWDVTSTLVAVDLPRGAAALPPGSLAAVQRAQREDLNKPQGYQVAFMRNPSGRVVFDRRFNTAALLSSYYGSSMDFAGRIAWDPKDPNALSLSLPDGGTVTTRVLRRSEQQLGEDRFETSEFFQQLFDNGEPGRVRVKASQNYTKFKFRDEAVAAASGGPAIVATQFVSDYLTPFDGEAAYMAAANQPIVLYTFRIAFVRHHDAAHMGHAVHVS